MPNNYIVDGERVSADAYNKAKYEDLRVRVLRGKKGAITTHAEARHESVNAFINRAISETMERDNAIPAGSESRTEGKNNAGE